RRPRCPLIAPLFPYTTLFRSIDLVSAVNASQRPAALLKNAAHALPRDDLHVAAPRASRARPSSCATASQPSAASRRLARTSSSRSEEHTSELQSRGHLVCRLL